MEANKPDIMEYECTECRSSLETQNQPSPKKQLAEKEKFVIRCECGGYYLPTPADKIPVEKKAQALIVALQVVMDGNGAQELPSELIGPYNDAIEGV